MTDVVELQHLATRLEPTLDTGPSDLPETLQTEVPEAHDELERCLRDGRTVRVGRYFLLHKLGQGAMSVVFVAFDERLDRRVALKLLSAGRESREDRLRMQREARALARLSHPNVVQVYDVEQFEGRMFLSMEYVEGQTLRDWMKQQPRPWPEVLRLFRQVGAGLNASHEEGLVHRDLKPANVLVDANERVRVADFGLARANIEPRPATERSGSGFSLDDSISTSYGSRLGEPLTELGDVMGTPAYMAYEQMKGVGADARSDQFSFCVMLFEALYGHRPFEGQSLSELSRNVGHGRSLPPDPPASLPAVPGWLHDAVMRGLHPDADQRWPSMAALLVVLTPAPRASRARRWWLTAATIAMLGTASAAALTNPAPEDRPCRAFEDMMTGIWDEPTRARAEAATIDTGLSFALDSWTRTRRVLDGYREAWIDARTEVCESHQRGEVSDVLHDRQVACLEHGRNRLGALVDALLEANPTVVERSASAANQLPRQDECLDIERLAQEVTPPPEGPTAVAVAEVRKGLAQALTHASLGRHAPGRALAEQLVQKARAADYPPALAEALLLKGKLEDLDGDYDAAAQTLNDAVWVARTAGHERIEGDAASMMMMVRGDRQVRFEPARIWQRHAQAVLARHPTDHELEASLQMRMGSFAGARGELDVALEHYQRVKEQREHQDGPQAFSVAAPLLNISSVLKEQGHYRQAYETGERALAIRIEHLGPEHPEVAMTLYSLAIILENKGDYERAIALYRKTLGMLERSLGPEHMRVAYPRFGLASALHFIGRHEEALVEFEASLRSLEANLGPEHPHVATAHNNIGLVLDALGRPKEALAAFDRSTALATARLGPEHSDVARAQGNRGMVLLDLGDLAGAAQAYTRALEIYQKSLEPGHPDLGYPLTGLGEVALAEGRYRDAVRWLEQAVDVRLDVPALERGESRLLLAKALWDGGTDRPRAVALAQQAEKILAEGGSGCASMLEQARAWRSEHPTP